MARDPGSVWAPLPEAGAPDGMVKDAVIVHSTGDNGTAASTRRFFELVGTVTESTFIIGWGPEDPTLQIMDSTDIADANVQANRRAIAIEVVGDGRGGYNAWQRSELIRVIGWCMATHPGIAARICRTSTDAGLGWHIMFGAPGPWAAVAKICPGPFRIAELQDDIFPAIFAGTEATTEDYLMADSQEYKNLLGTANNAAVIASEVRNLILDPSIGILKQLGDLARAVAADRDDVDEKALAASVTASLVPAVVAALAGKGGLTADEVKAATLAAVRQVFADAAV